MNESAIPFEEFLKDAGWIRDLAGGLVRDDGEAEELVQETLLAAWQRPPSDRRNLRGWLATVLSNALRQRRRSAATRTRYEEAAPTADESSTPDELVARVETQRHVAKLALELEDPYRTCLLLRYYDGLRATEIAKRLSVPVGTVRWRQQEGLERLRRRLDQEYSGDRRAWCAALLPLIPKEALRTAGGAALLSGVVLMKTVKLAAVAAIALVAIWGVPQLIGDPFDRPDKTSPIATEPVTSPNLASDVGPSGDDAQPRRTAAADSPPIQVPTEAVGEIETTGAWARLLDPTGSPLANATLRLARDPRISATSFADGRVEMELGENTAAYGIEHTFLASAPGRETVSKKALIRRGRLTPLGDLHLGPGGSLQGHVVDSNGRPIENAWVKASPSREGEDPTRWQDVVRLDPASEHYTRSDARGFFRLDGVPLGKARAWAGADDMIAGYSDAVTMSEPGVMDGLRIALEPRVEHEWPLPISGVVLDPDGEPVSNATVNFRWVNDQGSGRQGKRTDTNGRFEFQPVLDLPYEVSALHPKGLYAEAILPSVEPGTESLTLRLGTPRFMNIRVHDPSEHTISSFFVESRRINTTLAGTITGSSEGGVARALIPARPFELIIRANGFSEHRAGPFNPDTAPDDIDLTLAPIASFRGTVVDGDGPLSGVLVRAYRMPTNRVTIDGFPVRIDPSTELISKTDQDGRFDLSPRRPGTYYLRFSKEGRVSAERGPLHYDPKVALEPLEIRLRGGGTITGTVLLPEGTNPAGILVALTRGDGFARTARLEEDGAYRFERLIPGDYQIAETDEELDDDFERWESSHSISGAPMRITSNSKVPEGSVTRFDLDLRRVTLSINVDIDTWTAGGGKIEATPITQDDRGHVRILGSSAQNATQSIEGVLHGNGILQLSLPRTGPYRIRFTAPASAPIPLQVSDFVEVLRGETLWSISMSTGQVDLNGGSPDQDLLLRMGDFTRLFEITIRPNAGTTTLIGVPTGHWTVRRKDHAPTKFEVVKGTKAAVDTDG